MGLTMATYRTIQSQFTSGIISPLSSGLVGTDYYNKGLEIAENCFYSSMGGVYKRPGTKLEAAYKVTPFDIIPTVIPLDCDGVQYVIIIGGKYIKGYLLSGDNDPSRKATEMAVDCSEAWGTSPPLELSSDMSWAVNDEKIYCASKNSKPFVIERAEDSTGTLYFKVSFISFVAAQNPDSPTEGSVKTTVVDFENQKPTVIGFYDGRMFLGATAKDPATIWFSRSYDASTGNSRYNDFTTTYSVYSATQGWQYVDLADLAGSYTFDDVDGTRLQWLYSMQGLLVGTNRGVYACATKSVTSTTDNPIAFTRESSLRATGHCVTSVGNYLLYVSSEKVIALAYSQQYNSYTGGIITEAISQYIRGADNPIVSIAATEGVVPHLYVAFEAGDTFCCVFDPQNSLVAWSRLTFHVCHPLAVASTTNGARLYFLFGKETSSTNPKITSGEYSLETLDEVSPQRSWQYPHLDHWEYVEFDKDYYIAESAGMYRGMYSCVVKRNYSVYNDTKLGSRVQSGPAAYDVTYPDHTYRSTVRRDSEGATSSELYHDWFIGQYYSFGICLPRAELPANGTSQGNRRAVNRVILRLFNSIGGEVFLFPGFPTGLIRDPRLGDIDNDTTVPYGPTYLAPKNNAQLALYKLFGDEKYNDWQQLFTGDKSINFITPTVSDDRIAIVQHDPLPFTVCAVIVERAVKES